MPEDELTIDFKKIENFFNKNKKVLVPLVLILIPMLFSFIFRIQPAYLPITDDWAEDSVYASIKSSIQSQIDKDYPNLPDKNKQALIDEQFKQFLAQNEEYVKEQIKQTSAYFKSNFQDEDGHTYLLAIDPYTYYRQTRNLITKGHVWDIEKNGTAYNDHMIAPLGVKIKKKFLGANLHVWIEYLFFRIAYLFKSISLDTLDRDLMHVVFYVPVILSMLAVIPAFFIGRKFAGNFGGFVTAFLVAIHPAFINRTAGGFADTDAYNVLFPLLITGLFLFAFYAKDWKKYLYASLAGLLTGVYAWVWVWWYIFDFVLGAGIVYLAYLLVTKNKKFRDSLIVFVVFLVVAGIFASIFSSFSAFVKAPIQPLSAIKIKEVTHPTLWPNVYRTVAELNKASFKQIINTMGGGLLMLISFIGILLLFIKKRINAGTLFLLWFIGTMYTCTKGIRFTLLLVPVFSIGIGIAFGWFYNTVSKWIEKELKISKMLSKTTVLIILALLLISPVKAGWNQVRTQEIPSMNDAWYDSLTYIKENSSKDAIINSWWDFGHWFKAIADRAVTFDGASQNTPMAHWIGKVLLTSNEDEAIGILRMLDCGSNNAFEELNNVINYTPKSIDILYQLVVLDKEEAKEVLLANNLTEEQAEKVLKYTHCQPPENYFITSGDMVSKSGVWAHFGSWNFTKAAIYRDISGKPRDQAIQILKENYSLTEDKAEETYNELQVTEGDKWIAGWPSYASGLSSCSKQNNKLLICDNGLRVNLTNYDAYFMGQQGKVIPYSITHNINDTVKEKILENSNLDFSVSLIEENGKYFSILMSKELAMSMFNRLYFYKGLGLEHFEEFSHKRDLMGSEIYVWKVDWKGK